MKKVILITALISLCWSEFAFSQMKIMDKAIRHQQERMVYKQWDKNKFTPSTKVFGVQINPLWYTTWGLHPNYIKKDHRPLGPIGPQTSRVALVKNLRTIETQYVTESDSLRTIVINEFARNSNLTPEPLWELYYKREFKDLLTPDVSKYMDGLSPEQKAFLVDTEYWQSHVNKMAELKERLEQGRDQMADRGNRLIFYHRILKEYRQAMDWWGSNKAHAPKALAAKNKIQEQKTNPNPFGNWTADSDKVIADKVVRQFRYIN